jgi:hypothetical protein
MSVVSENRVHLSLGPHQENRNAVISAMSPTRKINSLLRRGGSWLVAISFVSFSGNVRGVGRVGRAEVVGKGGVDGLAIVGQVVR